MKKILVLVVTLYSTLSYAEKVQEIPEEFRGIYHTSLISTDGGYSFKSVNAVIGIVRRDCISLNQKDYIPTSIVLLNEETLQIYFESISKLWVIVKTNEKSFKILVRDTKKQEEQMRIIATSD